MLFLLVVAVPPSGAGAATVSQGTAVRQFTDWVPETLAANDDGSTPPVELGFTANFFGAEFDSVFVNNNGNITFDQALVQFTPDPLADLSRLIIAPFWADVDTRADGSLQTTYGQTEVEGRRAFAVNWVRVGYFNRHDDKLNSFQLVLVDRSDVAPGDFDIEMNYDSIQWETGDASGGEAGFGGTPARVGWSNGSGSKWFEVAGSGEAGAFLDSSPSALRSGSRNSTQAGRYRFEVRNGRPNPDLLAMTWNTFKTGGSPISKVLYHQIASVPGSAGVAVLQESCFSHVIDATIKLEERTGRPWYTTFNPALEYTPKCSDGDGRRDRGDRFGNAIVSDLPLDDVTRVAFPHTSQYQCDREWGDSKKCQYETRNYLAATIDVGGSFVRAYTVHVTAKSCPRCKALRNAQIERFSSDLAAEAFDGTVIVGGDFNASCDESEGECHTTCDTFESDECGVYNRATMAPMYRLGYQEVDEASAGVSAPFDEFTCCLEVGTFESSFRRKLDFLFTSRAQVLSADAKNVRSSDHKPVVAWLEI